MSNFSVDGLVTGLNTTSIIQQLMQLERAPLTVLTNTKTAYDKQATAWGDINTVLSSLSTAANDLSTTQKLALFTAMSSASSVATATVTAGASVSPTSLTLRVDALATAHQMASAGAASAGSALGAGTATLGVGLPALGIGYAKADGAVTAGAHAVVVTQATTAGSVTSSPWAGTVTIGASNNTIDVTVNGQARTATIASGTYTSLESLAAAVQSAIGTDAKVAAVGGRLQVSTLNEGSAATLQITGGTALATAGLSAGAQVTGTDGTVTVDGVANTVTNATAGGQLTLNGSGGSFTIRTTGGLRAGSGTAHVIRSTAGDTMSDLATDISAADASIRTQTIDTGSGTSPTRLVATAAGTGLAKSFTLEFEGYTGMADGAETLTQGRDASVRFGGVSITRASNTLTDVIAGVSINLQSAQPNTEVTIAVDRDATTLSTKAKALVDALNNALNKITSLTKYDADKKVAAVLTGDSRATDIRNTLLTAMQVSLSSGTIQSLSQVGISISRQGTYTFDSAKFDAAVKSDYDAVSKLLARTGTSTDSRIGYIGATHATLARTWPFSVRITQAAEQASVTGNSFGTLGQAETIAITTIGGTVTYQALGGQDAAAVVAGLNAALGAANAGATASVVGGAIKITTTGYGSSSTLSVTAGAGTGLTGTSAGINVAGTIDGQAATGSGQVLTSTTGDATGLMLKVTATQAEVSGAGNDLDLGTVSYSQGAVGGLTKALNGLVGTSGKVTASKDGAVANSKSQQDRIDDFEARLELVQQRYSRQFAALETLMGQLKDQGAWLAAQIGGLPKWGG